MWCAKQQNPNQENLMSSFVVEPKTINRVLTFLRAGLDRSDHVSTTAQRKLREIKWDIETREQVADLGQAMYNMNMNAVARQYPGCDQDELPGFITEDGKLFPFKYTAATVSEIQALKSLEYWLCQCNHRNVDETALFKAFTYIRRSLSTQIIRRLPEYKKAEWA
jgi:hypothetical protein